MYIHNSRRNLQQKCSSSSLFVIKQRFKILFCSKTFHRCLNRMFTRKILNLKVWTLKRQAKMQNYIGRYRGTVFHGYFDTIQDYFDVHKGVWKCRHKSTIKKINDMRQMFFPYRSNVDLDGLIITFSKNIYFYKSTAHYV